MRTYFLLILCVFTTFLSLSAQDDPDYTAGVANFDAGNNFKQTYQLDSALVRFNKAADYFKRSEYTGNYVLSRYSAADVLILQSKFEDARAVFDEIYPVALAKFGEKHQNIMRIYYGYGTVEFYSGKNKEAMEYYKKSLALSEELLGADNLYSAQVYSSLGNTYNVAGDYKSAQSYYLKDLQIREKNLGTDHPTLATTHNNLSLAYESLGDYENADIQINKAIELSRKYNGEVHPETAIYLSGKGNICYRRGQNDLALEYFSKAQSIEQKLYGEMHKKIADELNNIGLVYKDKEDYENALVAFKDAYEIQKKVLGAQHPDIAMTCNNIANVLDRQGKPESALAYYQEAIDVKKLYFGENHPELAAYYNNIGISYASRGMDSLALENYLKSSAIFEQNHGDRYSGLIVTYNNIADLYRKQKHYEIALNFYQKSFAANVKTFNIDTLHFEQNPPVAAYSDINKLLQTLENKAKTYSAMYVRDSLIVHAENAYNCYLSCDSAITIARRFAEKQSDKIALANKSKSIYEDAVIASAGLSYIADKDRRKQEFELQAFYFSEKNKASVLADAVAASEAKQFAGIPDEILNMERELKINIAATEQKKTESSDRKEIEYLENQLFELNSQLRDFNKRIEAEFPKYFESKYKDVFVDAESIKKSLDKETAVRSYFIGRDVLIIFTITQDGVTLTSADKPSDFEDLVREYIGLCHSGVPRDFPIMADRSNQVYRLLFPEKQNPEIKKLIIIPDGILGMLPFENLFTESYQGDIMQFKDYPFLIKQKQISYYFSALLYYKAANADRRKDAPFDLLSLAPVFADITNRNVNGVDVTELPGSETEVNRINALFLAKSGKTEILLRNQALESVLKSKKLGDYRILHIATHGIVNPEYPELSGILLYPEKQTADGILYSGEIYNLQLNADLTVLSACETGVGKVSKSEGIIGLSRALLYAGTRNVIVSSWMVSDASTSDLMVDFYQNILTQDMTYSDALHASKLKMINGGGNYAHPFFWSPFVLIGK